MADFFSWLLLLFVFGNKLSFSSAGQRLPGYHAMAKQLSCQDGNGVHRTENGDSEQKRRKKKKKYLNTELVNHYQVHEQAPYNLGCNFRYYSNTVKYFLELTSEYRCWKNCCKFNSSTKQRNTQSVCHLPSAQLFGEPVSCFYMILALTSLLDFQRMPHANPYLLDVQKVFWHSVHVLLKF